MFASATVYRSPYARICNGGIRRLIHRRKTALGLEFESTCNSSTRKSTRQRARRIRRPDSAVKESYVNPAISAGGSPRPSPQGKSSCVAGGHPVWKTGGELGGEIWRANCRSKRKIGQWTGSTRQKVTGVLRLLTPAQALVCASRPASLLGASRSLFQRFSMEDKRPQASYTGEKLTPCG